MSDEDMVVFLGLQNEPKGLAAVQALKPKDRATYEAMAKFCDELPLMEAGILPKPKNALLDYPRKRNPLWPKE